MKVKVDKKIKPIHYSQRKTPTLVISHRYYVSFGSNIAKQCTLIEIDESAPIKRVTIEMPDGIYVLYADEIGLTPEEAVVNTVTL